MAGRVFLAPRIPYAKRQNALASFAKEVEGRNVVALYDSTRLASGKEGLLFTRAGFYAWRTGSKPLAISYNDLGGAQVVEPEAIDGDSGTTRPRLVLSVNNESVELKAGLDVDPHELAELLNGIVELRDRGEVDDTDRMLIVEEMDEAVREAYLELLVNLVFEDDGNIDERELAEIQVLMTQLNCSAELRFRIRTYLAEPDISTPDLLDKLDQHAPRGSERPLHFSLVKEIIRVIRCTHPDYELCDNAFLRRICERYEINEAQVEVVAMAVDNDLKILDGDTDDSVIVRNAKDLSAKAAAVGVPIAAVYLSGSVAGLSAAGITSGLATLGLGGVLGLSSMVTGIGVAVIIGVGAYKGVRWMTRGGERERQSRRDFMVQEVIRLNQRTISAMVGDINLLADRIVALTRSSEINRLALEKLGNELRLFSAAFETLRDRNQKLEGSLDAEA